VFHVDVSGLIGLVAVEEKSKSFRAKNGRHDPNLRLAVERVTFAPSTWSLPRSIPPVYRCATRGQRCTNRTTRCAARRSECSPRCSRCTARSSRCAARHAGCAARSSPCTARSSRWPAHSWRCSARSQRLGAKAKSPFTKSHAVITHFTRCPTHPAKEGARALGAVRSARRHATRTSGCTESGSRRGTRKAPCPRCNRDVRAKVSPSGAFFAPGARASMTMRPNVLALAHHVAASHALTLEQLLLERFRESMRARHEWRGLVARLRRPRRRVAVRARASSSLRS
jgi:hypothetical protein